MKAKFKKVWKYFTESYMNWLHLNQARRKLEDVLLERRENPKQEQVMWNE